MSENPDLFACPIVPVLTINTPEQAVPLAETLGKVGFSALEVTFRTAHAATAIAAMRKACPDLHIGAGTITGAAQFDAACAAGSDFLVSPGRLIMARCNSPIAHGSSMPRKLLKAVS